MIRSALLATLLTLAAATAASAVPSVFPTGTTIYDPSKAYSSYILFDTPDAKTHLIDMDGNDVHRWDYQGYPSVMLDPAITHGARGHVLVQLAASTNQAFGKIPGMQIFANKTIAELDWSGKVVWQWGDQAPSGEARQHHDWQRLANGDTLVLSTIAGHLPGFAAPMQQDDTVYEVSPAGKVVWTWRASEHLDEFGFTPEQLALVRAAHTQDFLHVNDMTTLGPNRWFDAGDKRFAPDNVIIDSRDANFIIIIDKHSGNVVWRLGPNLKSLTGGRDQVPPNGAPVDQFVGQHDAHLIAKGLPGAGDLLLFDDQGEAGYPAAPLSPIGGSRVLEIDPTTDRVVWSYVADDSAAPIWSFYSTFISSAQRLPNGNTLIDEGMNGRFFQVTPSGEIVWEYVSPYFAKIAADTGTRLVVTNLVYRALAVPYDWAPAGTAHAEKAVHPPDLATFRDSP